MLDKLMETLYLFNQKQNELKIQAKEQTKKLLSQSFQVYCENY